MMELLLIILVLLLAGLGCLLLLVAAIGIVRMPDTYMRMQVASKASALGAGLVLAGSAIAIADGPTAARAVITLVFLCMTTPVAAHVLGRAATHTGVKFSEETQPLELPDLDEAAGRKKPSSK